MSVTQKELNRRLCRRNIIIYGVILLGSIVWFWFVLYNATKDVKRVRNWIEVPCLVKNLAIIQNNIAAEPWFAEYAWIIFYTYEYNGCEYTSRRYNILEKNKVLDNQDQSVVERTPLGTKPKINEPYSVGDKTVCFVNPDNPSDAVLVREVRSGAIIIKRLLLPGIAVATFLTLLLYALWRDWYWLR